VHRVDCVVAVNIAYDANIDKAREIMVDLAKKYPGATEVKGCHVTGLNDVGVTMTLTISCADASTATSMKYDLYESIKKRFDGEGIALAHLRPTPATSRTEK
jgi:small-conductance mechanosensitive channel